VAPTNARNIYTKRLFYSILRGDTSGAARALSTLSQKMQNGFSTLRFVATPLLGFVKT
jgi:hypothetical protein